MNYRRDADERLLTQLETKKQFLRQQQSKIKVYEEESKKRSTQLEKLRQENQSLSQAHANKILEMNVAYIRLQDTNSLLETQIKELGDTVNYFKSKISALQKNHQEQVQTLKDEIELSKSDHTSKIKSLEDSIAILRKNFNVEDLYEKDRDQLIKQSIKDKEGNIRGMLLQNQQLSSQLEHQSHQVVIMLKKIEKLQELIARLKREMDIQKQVEAGLVKRSTAAQSLVRQLNQKCKQMQAENDELRKKIAGPASIKPAAVKEAPSPFHAELTNCKAELNMANVENSKLKNEINYLHNKIRLHETKFQGLAAILSQHLENILLTQKSIGIFGQPAEQQFQINLATLRNKEIVEWKPEQTATVVYLLLTQIKSIISKKNLISLPDLKNPNVSIVDEPPNKEAVNLPKIASQYDQMISLQQKRPSRFKGIPLDISTKIVRSELRNWGTKVGAQKKTQKSHSHYSRNSSFI